MKLLAVIPPLVVLPIILGFALHAATVHATNQREPLVGKPLSFHYGTAEPLDPSDADDLADWAVGLAPETHIDIRGYDCAADRLPSSTAGELLKLAEARAERLKALLVDRGVDPERMSTVAYDSLPGAWSCQAVVVAVP